MFKECKATISWSYHTSLQSRWNGWMNEWLSEEVGLKLSHFVCVLRRLGAMERFKLRNDLALHSDTVVLAAVLQGSTGKLLCSSWWLSLGVVVEEMRSGGVRNYIWVMMTKIQQVGWGGGELRKAPRFLAWMTGGRWSHFLRQGSGGWGGLLRFRGRFMSQGLAPAPLPLLAELLAVLRGGCLTGEIRVHISIWLFSQQAFFVSFL